MQVILLLPLLFFALSVCCRFRDRSYRLIQDKITLDQNYSWAIPIKRIKELQKLVKKDLIWEHELDESILARRFHYGFLLLCFISVFIVGYVYRFFS